MRAAIYARVSTDKQAEKYGIPSQIEALRKRCLEKDWTPVFDGGKDAFIDDGYSGAELDRPALNRLRKTAGEDRVDVVLAYDPDRLSRKLYHQMILAEEFEKQGIKLEFITQDMGDSPEDRMFFNMRGLVAEYEREKIRERTIRGSREKARQGKVVCAGVPPFGYRYNKEKATLEEDPEKAKTLRLIFYTFANERLSLLGLAERLNHLHVPTPKGGDRWRSSTLGIMLRNEVYIGRLHQFKQYRIQPKRRLQPATRISKTARVMRPKEEWITVEVPALVPNELFEAVQRKLEKNAELSRRNTKREYLLSGLLYCTRCGGRMGGHVVHDVPYYRCYRKVDPDRVLLDSEGKPKPCSCPEIQTEVVDPVVWDTVCQLVKDPDFLIQELHTRNTDDSQTREILERELQLCNTRLKAIPEEQRRLVEGYRKGLYADFMMREDMELIQKEQGELEKRKAELERQLSRRQLTQAQEARIRSFAEKVGTGLETLDFARRQELLRLLVEKVIFDGQVIEIQTVIPLGEQLHPVHRRGHRGWDCINPRLSLKTRLNYTGAKEGEGNVSLDLSKVAAQVAGMISRLKEGRADRQQRLRNALDTLAGEAIDLDGLKKKISDSKTSWLVAGLTDGLGKRYPAPPAPDDFTVIATDGSHIEVDRHHATRCYLINIGAVAISYGNSPDARLSSTPRLYADEPDMVITPPGGGREYPLDANLLGIKRSVEEWRHLTELTASVPAENPCLALLDGTLIQWGLEGYPEFVSDALLADGFLRRLDDIKKLNENRRLAVASYISFPGSTDVANVLKVAVCPNDIPDCDKCCPPGKPKECDRVAGVRDRELFTDLLAEGERSALFVSPSKIVKERYGEHRVYFFYVKLADEVARIEVPQWVAENSELLNLAHGMVVDQGRRGHGYPVVLSEAHEQAVVTGADRENFWELVEASLAAEHLPSSGSAKSLSKRTRWV